MASVWERPLAMVFIDGGHTEEAAQSDYAAWTPHVMNGGLLAIHDVLCDAGKRGTGAAMQPESKGEPE